MQTLILLANIFLYNIKTVKSSANKKEQISKVLLLELVYHNNSDYSRWEQFTNLKICLFTMNWLKSDQSLILNNEIKHFLDVVWLHRFGDI